MESIDANARVGERLKAGRIAAGLTLEALAERAGVSRAMISKIERGEVSPSAAILGRLCAALGLSLSHLFSPQADREPDPLVRRADQPLWQDPDSGYVRRNVSAARTGSPVEIVEVEFPPGAGVSYDHPWRTRIIDQHVWLFEGVLDLTVSGETRRLQAGDCLHMRLDGPITYRNPGETPARYAVILTMLEPSHV